LHKRHAARLTLACVLACLFTATAVGAPARAARDASQTFNLADFGAVGDGQTDDGPALQAALDAVVAAGGGTLLVPAGRYAIVTPVGIAGPAGLQGSLVIRGVASATPIAPPTAGGDALTRGLDLVSEFAPRTGEEQVAISIWNFRSLLIQDITFIGTPDIATDTKVTLAIADIDDAVIRHCEFYGLSNLASGGSMIQAMRSHLTIRETAFLGCTANSGLYTPVVQNWEWKGITIEDTIFADYGQRAELYGKTGYGAPLCWINVGHALPPTPDSPRREIVLRRLFLDEGGWQGVIVQPARYQNPTVPIDLFYATGLYVNVSNFFTTGIYLSSVRQVLVEDSLFTWSQQSDTAIQIYDAQDAILDRIRTSAAATRIRAEYLTTRITVIDSVYKDLASAAAQTIVLNPATPDDDPVRYVRAQFESALGREPDAAAHYYWSRRMLDCGADLPCVASQRAALAAYLAATPAPTFAVNGRVTDEDGAPLAGASVTLAGTHSSTTTEATTNADGSYSFARLPTSGAYTVAASKRHYAFAQPSRAVVTPAGAQTFDFSATLNRHAIAGRLLDERGLAIVGATLTLSGTRTATATSDANGKYSFTNLAAGGDYTVNASSALHTFSNPSQTFTDLDADRTADFVVPTDYKIAGRVTSGGSGLAGVTVTLTGSKTGTTTTDSGGNYSFNVPIHGDYTVAPSKKNYAFDRAAATFKGLTSDLSADFAATLQTVFNFAATSYTVAEGGGSVTINVMREGDTTTEASVVYEGHGDTAKLGSDFVASIGLLTFAPGETSKSFAVFITDDAFAEGPERFTLTLAPSDGAVAGDAAVASVTIDDNDVLTSLVNPADDDEFFVRQHYRDFFSREPDAPGLKFWTDEIGRCGTDARCREARRVSVSAAFFLSIEFKETGYLVYRLYRASYGRAPARVGEFMLDSRVVGDGVVVGAAGWAERLAANKRAFLQEWTRRPEFTQQFAGYTDYWFLQTLFVNMNVTPTDARREALLAKLAAGATRAEVLAEVIEDEQFKKQEFNRAFVLMQYFGYLRRNPNDPPDSDLTGYNYWLGKLNEFGGDYEKAEMVKAFLSSTEYRGRFGN
jgi:hypothetical protein